MLERLGFCSDEITVCEVRDGLFIVPAQLDGDAVGLVLATARTSAITITRDYASVRGWRVEDQQLMPSSAVGYARDEVAFATVPTFTVLGAEGHFDRAVVGGIDRYRVTGAIRPVVGAIGKSIFRGRALALDYQASAIAVSSPVRAAWHSRSTKLVPVYRFAMIGAHEKLDPLVEGIRFFGVELKLYLDTGVWSSALSLDAYTSPCSGSGLLDRFIRWRARSRFRTRRPVPIFFTLPDGTRKRHQGYITSSLRPWSEWMGVDRVDGWLGGSFLSQWVTVLDFDSGTVSLFAAPTR